MSTFKLTISTPYGLFYEKEVDIVTLKTSEGYIGLQKNRIPFISAIEISSLFIKVDGTTKIAAIGGGIVFVEKDYIDIFTDDIQWKEHLNKSEIQAIIDETNQKLQALKNDNIEKYKTELTLKRAMNKLETLLK
ncbi:ATP synthase F1 subunit epsilon [Metamycoplasma sualvi]|uniref:ATP synthase F1 subunit epsilon n=1 Tax=Metamycoplasma sualvi TaxID=2125 RepID=UPI003872AFE9